MSDGIVIRVATAADRPQLRQAIIELQDNERRLHSTRLPGVQIADDYLAWLESRTTASGALLIAETQGEFVGFAAGWIEQENSIAETPDSNRFGYVSDVCIMPPYRGRRFAGRLLEALAQRLASRGITRLRLGTLAANAAARAAYERAGFAAYEIVYEKRIGATK
jgi:ribosomal protein S18 acetylase RimI-like enzyme